MSGEVHAVDSMFFISYYAELWNGVNYHSYLGVC